jgi:hypothetical protein
MKKPTCMTLIGIKPIRVKRYHNEWGSFRSTGELTSLAAFVKSIKPDDECVIANWEDVESKAIHIDSPWGAL